MKAIYAFLIAVLMFSKSYSQQDTGSIKLGFVKKIPIEKFDFSCSAYYAYDTISMKSQKYILVTDIAKIAIINVNGRKIYLKKVSRIQLSKTLTKSVFRGNGYRIILTTKDKLFVNETLIQTGTLIITKGTYKKTIKIHGESSC